MLLQTGVNGGCSRCGVTANRGGLFVPFALGGEASRKLGCDGLSSAWPKKSMFGELVSRLGLFRV